VLWPPCHDTAAERIDVDQHRMTLSLSRQIWIDIDQFVLVEIPSYKAATTTMDFLGAVAKFTLKA
jgi:hypothetical protein